jgi:hypothetical protein
VVPNELYLPQDLICWVLNVVLRDAAKVDTVMKNRCFIINIKLKEGKLPRVTATIIVAQKVLITINNSFKSPSVLR